MFFTGTLQEGISKALQETKLVVCFVTDNEDESKTWEDEYLKDDTIAPSLDRDAVLLRLEAGSQEAGYLAALVPLPKNPTLVVIKNGELKEYISAGTSKEQFVRRVGGAFQAQAQASVMTQTGGTAATTSTETVSSPSHPQAPGQVAPAPSGTTSSSPGQQQSQPASRSSTAGHEQSDRKQREEAERRRREKGKMKEGQEGQAQEQAQDPEKAKQNDVKRKAAQQLAERQRQAREERARVLKRIEDDRAERKARDEARRAERRAASLAPTPAAASAAGENAEGLTAAGPSSTAGRQHDQCAIQVRLFDGSTVRTRFPARATLATDVRRWVDSVRADGDEPYTFKVILTPLPNRAVDPAADEGRTLLELGLAPSSTLVLAPVDRASSPAYPRIRAGLNNPLSRLIAAVLAFVGSVLGGVVGTLTGSGTRGRLTNNGGGGGGGGQVSGEQQKEDRAQGRATGRDGAGSSRINGFNNPDDRQRDYQLYNGNSVSLPKPPNIIIIAGFTACQDKRSCQESSGLTIPHS